ncbi:hypothetical protein FZEAL_2123 [Fusarium zealandicum]|uniref:Phospholipase/carboxylesterase/thioesterase domain-containing protein n=1 Tax=Fusarium zealandicum TaxID=1053134 RepID=A0A8H4US25_9HYPO|nr:hypothetical protein FZEAL_2123 [Fusarium zealandicum]
MTDDDRRSAVSGLRSAPDLAMAPSKPPTQGFGPAHVLEPHSGHSHTHTMVFLHGRGSGAEEFAEELMQATLLSNGRSLQEELPGWRWVFPAAREVWSEVFEEYMPMWFELKDGGDGERDCEGLREAIGYVKGVLKEEKSRLRDGVVMLGGISQGGAVGLWTVLSLMGDEDGNNVGEWMGGFVGSSTWIPFGDEVDKILMAADQVDGSVEQMLGSLVHNHRHGSSIPILMGHGLDDAYVDVDLGRQASMILKQVGCDVDWKEYRGAEQEGHWFKVPEQMDHIYDFMRRDMVKP